jgi:Skp family chaperone for outer membrane proteins
MVNGKPQKIQQNVDLSYILPFASDFSFGNPVTDAIMLARTGKNGIGQQIIKPGMTGNEKAAAWATYLANAAAPAAISPYNIEKLYNAYQGNVDSKGRQYDMQGALLQTLGGIKNVPINTEELFKQQMSKNNMDQRNIKSIMSTIAKDQSLSKQQKIEMYQDHVNQLKQLSRQAKEMQQAYKREKKREAN